MRTNITEVYFNGHEMTTILIHWQHDYKQILKFADLDLPFAYEVDFANAGDKQSKTMIGNADGVEIPDEYLMTGKPINAYIYLHDASDSGETVRKISIQVHGRPERTEEIPEPHQQSVIDQAIAALDDAVEQTASDVQITGEYKEEAHGYADEAKGYAERAESAESEVEGYATRAETAESHAQGYAQTASDKASEASGYASDAHGDANSASSSASDAHRYASDAYGYADSAYQSYQGAIGYAHDAHTYAQSASGSASDASSAKDLAVQAKNDAISAKNDAVSAKNDAETAKGKAEDAQESAERAAGSVLGLTADATVDANIGTPSVEVDVTTEADHKKMSFAFHNIKGVQGNPGISPTITVTEITGGHSVAVTDAQGTQTFDVMDGEVSEEELETALIDKADVITSSASGEIVTIADGANNLPVKDLSVSLLPIQSLNGYDKPWPPKGGDNLYTGSYTPISAYLDASTHKVTDGTLISPRSIVMPCDPSTKYYVKSGKPGTMRVGAFQTSPQVNDTPLAYETATESSEPVNLAITTDANSHFLFIQFFINSDETAYGTTLENCLARFVYSIYENICPISGWTGVEVYQRGGNLYDSSQALISGYLDPSGSSSGISSQTNKHTYKIPIKGGATYTYSADIAYNTAGRTCCWYDADDNVVGSFELERYAKTVTATAPSNAVSVSLSLYNASGQKIALAVGNSADVNAPYVGSVYPITWQSSAGTVYHGSLDVLSGKLVVDTAIVDMGTLTWTYRSANACFSAPVSGLKLGGYLLCEAYKTSLVQSLSSLSNLSIWNRANAYGTTNVVVKDTNYTDATTFKSAVNGYRFVYGISSPQTYQLSENQIATYLGVNNFWSNGNGQIDLEYRCDTKLYIQQLTKPTEDDMVANANITSGKFFMVGNRLFLSTTAIAQGEQIVVGTNCSEVSLADALNQINA